MEKIYPSKVSYGLLGFIFLVFFGPLYWVYLEEGPSLKWTITFIFLALLFGIILQLFFKTRYHLSGEFLQIKVAWFRYAPIPISDITEVEKSHSILSAPAASLDRLEIKYGRFQSQLVSPKDQQAFVKDLLSLNPNIRLKGLDQNP